MSKALKALAIASASAVLLTGCGGGRDGSSGSSSGGSASGDSKSAGFDKGAAIGVSLPQKTSENWVLAEKLFNDGLTKAGFKPTVQFANNGVSEQQNQIQAMISKGVKVLIVGAVDGSQLSTQLAAAKQAGIKVIAYDRLLLNTANVDNYIAYDNYKVGQLQGQSLLEGLKARKASTNKWNIELFGGSPDDANAKVFFDGAMNILKPKIDDKTLTVASGQTTFQQAVTQGWKAENAQKRMDTLLSGFYQSKSIDGVLSPNDTLARTILTSAAAAGKPTPVVTGQDSEVESVKSIMEGKQYSTIYKDTTALVQQSIKAVTELQAGKEVPVNDTKSYNNGQKVVPAYLLTPVIVTKENAAKVYANDKTLAPLTK